MQTNKNASISFKIEQAKLLNGLKPEDKETALNLLQLFPETPFDFIIQALRNSKGDFDKAFDIITSGVSKPTVIEPSKPVVIEIGWDGKIKGKKNLQSKSKWENQVQQISNLFPDISHNRIESVLELLEGDVDATIVQLLNAPESQTISTPLPIVETPTPTPTQTHPPHDEEETNFFVQNPLYSVVAGGGTAPNQPNNDIEPEEEKIYEELSMQLNKIFAGKKIRGKSILMKGIPQPVLSKVPSLKEMIMCYVTNNLDKFSELFDEEFDIIPNPELKTELFEYIEYNFQEEDEDPKEKEKVALKEVVSFFGESLSRDPFFQRLHISDVEFARALQNQEQQERDSELAQLLQISMNVSDVSENRSKVNANWMDVQKLTNDQKSQENLFHSKFSDRGTPFDHRHLARYHSHHIPTSAFTGRFGNYKIRKISPISNSVLESAFERKRSYFESKYGMAPITLAFHGTPNSNVNSIIQRGLLVPGQNNNIRHTSDVGFWGRGIYLSPNAQTSISYCRGSGSLLVCAVLMGKCLLVNKRMDGQNITPGYDSHITANQQEIVIPTASQVLPIYVVEFENSYYNPAVGKTMTKSTSAIVTNADIKLDKMEKKMERLAAKFGKGKKMKLTKKQREVRRRI